jgi:tetrahydromethanopterin S-methyltransferase subunit E
MGPHFQFGILISLYNSLSEPGKTGMIFRMVYPKSQNPIFMASSLSSKSGKIVIIAGLALTAILIYQLAKRKKANSRKLSMVSDEGYETAEDILFPKRKFIRLG